MGGIKKILGEKVLDPLDVWGTQAEAAQKEASKQAELDRQALSGNQSNSPTMDSAAVSAAREAERQRRAAAAGQSSTVLTGSSGLATTATGSGKQLLGQ
jgi:hypothetical protein